MNNAKQNKKSLTMPKSGNMPIIYWHIFWGIGSIVDMRVLFNFIQNMKIPTKYKVSTRGLGC